MEEALLVGRISDCLAGIYKWLTLFSSGACKVTVPAIDLLHHLARWVGKHRTFILKCLKVKCWSDVKVRSLLALFSPEWEWEQTARLFVWDQQHRYNWVFRMTDQHSVYSANKINGMNRTRNEQNMSSHQSCKLTVVVGVGFTRLVQFLFRITPEFDPMTCPL